MRDAPTDPPAHPFDDVDDIELADCAECGAVDIVARVVSLEIGGVNVACPDCGAEFYTRTD